ncbi:MAG TPA: glycosyltransferase [Bacteroidales bacterium]|nr:glycosyltransferase [Bacteroidales bacterium]
MKRILLVSPFPPYIGGVSISVQRLYEYLKHSGYEVVRFNTQIDNPKFNFRALKFFKYFFLPVYLLTSKHYDVIHFHVSNIIPKLYVSMWRPLFPKTRFVITIHGQIQDLFMSKAGRIAFTGYDRIICVAKGDKIRVPARYRLKTAEIPAFIPPVLSDNAPEKIPQGLKTFLERDTFKILLNGVVIINDSYTDLYGFKDAIMLLEKLLALNKKADLILVVMGIGYNNTSKDYISDLKKYISDKGLGENVYWVEGAKMDLWPLLKKVNLLLRPTKSDGDALSIRESLYLNIPVISSDVVPRPEGTLVYTLNSDKDLLDKTLSLMDNYADQLIIVKNSGADINFADKIIEQYECELG